jgi:hypothetical protein
MAQNQEITITFTARTTSALAAGTLSQNRVQAVGTRTVGSPSVMQTFTATGFSTWPPAASRSRRSERRGDDTRLPGRPAHLHGHRQQPRGRRHPSPA